MGKPRVTVWDDALYDSALAHASPRLRCWLLLCGVHAIRSGTAIRLGPRDYANGCLSFKTKYNATQKIGVTHDLAVLLDQCKDPARPFVVQLSGGRWTRSALKSITATAMGHQFRKLKEKLGIPMHLRAHDMRRTTAHRVYRATRDMRDAQNVLGHASLASTVWYLQTEMAATPATLLELARTQPLTEKPQ